MSMKGHNNPPEQTIFRNAGRGDNYTSILNSMIQDKRLSYDHIGLLTYLLSQPHDWLVIAKCLIRKGCKRDKLYRLLADLTAIGYIGFIDIRDGQNQFTGRKYWVSDSPRPEKPETGKTLSEKPETGKPKKSIKTTANGKTGNGAVSAFSGHGKTGNGIKKQTNNLTNKQTYSELEGLNGSTHPIVSNMASWLWIEGGKNFYGDNPNPDQETFTLARNIISSYARTYGAEAVKRADIEMATKQATGDLITKPAKLFGRICEGQHDRLKKTGKSKKSQIAKLTEGF